MKKQVKAIDKLSRISFNGDLLGSEIARYRRKTLYYGTRGCTSSK